MKIDSQIKMVVRGNTPKISHSFEKMWGPRFEKSRIQISKPVTEEQFANIY